ncbi:MAG: TraR/DksA family transcriptional regulator [Bryobacteraceae bacterium]
MKRTRIGPEDEKETFCRLLLDKQAEVRNSLGTKINSLAVTGRVAEDDQGPISHDEFISLSLNSIDYEQLGLVEEALDRLKRGGFGVCQNCGTMIPRKRLRAIPWARYCVECQEQTTLRLGEMSGIESAPPTPANHW